MRKATCLSHPNIAFIKYWGHTDPILRLPSNPSLSMNLGALWVKTTVRVDEALQADTLSINGEAASPPTLARVSAHLDAIRKLAGRRAFAQVVSETNFPIGVGIASSAAAFAALTVAAAAAFSLQLPEEELSALARRGSGSASRSIPTGFVAWLPGDDRTSFAKSIAPPEHWELIDVIAVIAYEHKKVTSSSGHDLAPTSPLFETRIELAHTWFEQCKKAILERNIGALGLLIEADALLMHAVMMTSHPPLHYLLPQTMEILRAVESWRSDGLEVYYTMDAGPNVHLITPPPNFEAVTSQLKHLRGVKDVLISGPGGPSHLIEDHLC